MAKVLRALVLALAAICALLCSASAWASGQVPAQPQKTYSRTLFGETYTGTIESVISITSQKYNDTNSFNTTWEGCPVRKTRSGSFSWTSEAVEALTPDCELKGPRPSLLAAISARVAGVVRAFLCRAMFMSYLELGP